MQTKTNVPFNNDSDKMRDFYTQSKEEFLQTYSYISSESYDMTARKIKREAKQALALLARIAEEKGIEITIPEAKDYGLIKVLPTTKKDDLIKAWQIIIKELPEKSNNRNRVPKNHEADSMAKRKKQNKKRSKH